MRQRISVLMSAGLVLAAVATGVAQVQWGSPMAPKTGACFYDDTNFKGRSFCAEAGQNFASLPNDMRDKISSLRVFGHARVTVFKDDRFRGAAARFITDSTNLKNQGWNDMISSVQIENEPLEWSFRLPEWGNSKLPEEGACFYQDPDYGGKYFCVPRGASFADLPAGFNDKISSIRVMGAGVVIFIDHDFSGRSLRVVESLPRLRNWNDKISSLRVF